MNSLPKNTPDPSHLPRQRSDADMASDLIRQKVSRVYQDEPDASTEMQESTAIQQRSKHQQFMYELSTSGKDLAAVQTEWHNYYQSLPDDEKHQVWHEFYASQSAVTGRQTPREPQPHKFVEHKQRVAGANNRTKAKALSKSAKLRQATRSKDDLQKAIRNTVSAKGKLQAKHHVQSLLFGLGMGAIVILIFLFGFFNEVVIAPFIQPGRVAADTPLIVDENSVAPTAQPEVIIPKINVEIPVNYDETSTDEATIENDLEGGIVHYPTTVQPGENGNAAFFGHSSNNIFNKGKYKFAFVLLHTLVPGDKFYLTYNSRVYVYEVISKDIVPPNNVGVLGPVAGQTATATLITCDPPGTSLNRLIIVGKQITPDPTGNTQTTAPTTTTTTTNLPGNGPTLWSRFIHTSIGKASIVVALLAAGLLVIRRVNGSFRLAI